MHRTLLLLALAAPVAASATMVWSNNPGSAQGAHAGHGRPARPAITLHEADGAAAQLWLPTLEQRPLLLEQGLAQLKPSGMDNYHLLYAVRETSELHETALRYLYLRGKPSGRSPSELIYAEKTPLEIVPMPLTREHARYQSAQRITFMIRYAGTPLAGQPVTLQTSNGSRLDATSNERGRVVFELPSDFHHVAIGRDNNPPAEFFLTTRYRNAQRDYVTSLSAAYHVNPRHWQSQSGALWSGLAGFISGLGILGIAARRKAARG